MALVNGGFLHYKDMKKLLKKSSSVKPLVRFLAPLAEGQRAIVMALCPSCVRSSVRASVNFFFKKLLLRNY